MDRNNCEYGEKEAGSVVPKERFRDRTVRLTEGNPGKRIFFFALPLIFGSIFQQLYTFADTVIVGQKLGMGALAALGGTEWMTFLVFSTVQGMTGGFGVLIARHFGGKDYEKMRRAVWNAGALCTVLALLLLVISELGAGTLLRAIKTPPEAQKMAETYLHWLYAGIPVTFAYHMEAAILRAWGDSRTPFVAIAIASALNILLDVCFVMAWNGGIAGVAFATVLAQLISTIYCRRAIAVQEKSQERIDEKGYGCDKTHRLDLPMAKEQLALGIPLALQGVITALGGLAVQSVVNSFGVIFVAGYTAANKLYGLLETAASSYGHAVVNFVSQNFGAKRFERIRQGMRDAAVLGCLTAFVMSGIMLFAGKQILLCFLSGEKAAVEMSLAIGGQFLTVLAVFFPLLYLLYIFRAGIQGLGNGVIPLVSSGIQLIMRLGCAMLLTCRIGYAGLFWGEVFAWLGADILLIICWKKVNITKKM